MIQERVGKINIEGADSDIEDFLQSQEGMGDSWQDEAALGGSGKVRTEEAELLKNTGFEAFDQPGVGFMGVEVVDGPQMQVIELGFGMLGFDQGGDEVETICRRKGAGIGEGDAAMEVLQIKGGECVELGGAGRGPLEVAVMVEVNFTVQGLFGAGGAFGDGAQDAVARGEPGDQLAGFGVWTAAGDGALVGVGHQEEGSGISPEAIRATVCGSS